MLSLSLARLLYTLYRFLHLPLQNTLLGLLATKAFPQCLHTFSEDFSSVSIKENIICTSSVFHEDLSYPLSQSIKDTSIITNICLHFKEEVKLLWSRQQVRSGRCPLLPKEKDRPPIRSMCFSQRIPQQPCLMYCQRNFGIDCRKVYSSGYQCSELVDWLFGRIEYFVSWLL